jgi:hypothetical protein
MNPDRTDPRPLTSFSRTPTLLLGMYRTEERIAANTKRTARIVMPQRHNVHNMPVNMICLPFSREETG